MVARVQTDRPSVHRRHSREPQPQRAAVDEWHGAGVEVLRHVLLVDVVGVEVLVRRGWAGDLVLQGRFTIF
jgi:hypothetical protein